MVSDLRSKLETDFLFQQFHNEGSQGMRSTNAVNQFEKIILDLRRTLETNYFFNIFFQLIRGTKGGDATM